MASLRIGKKVVDLNEIFGKPRAEERLKELAAKGALTWQGRKIVLDPFTSLEFFYEVEGEDTFLISGKIKRGAVIEDLMPQDEPFSEGLLQRGCLRLWKEFVSEAWVRKVLSGPLLLSPLELKSFLEECEREGVSMQWKGRVAKLLPDPLPILVLKDKRGAFADLWMDYGSFGRNESGVETPAERFWEKDLLEIGFQRKSGENYNYFIPLDRATSALAFLLEAGWRLLDSEGREVRSQGAHNLEVQEREGALLASGSLVFGEVSAPLSSYLAAVKRREAFLPLNPHSVGLIELPSDWRALLEGEITSEGVKIPKEEFGLLLEVAPLPFTLTERDVSLAPSQSFRGELYPYQREGFEWLSFLYRRGLCGLLADEMGLGKTVQVLSFLSLLSGRSLVVMPSSLLFNWKRECEKFLPGAHICVYSGKDRKLAEEGIILTSYAILRQDRALLEPLEFEALILDEAQAIKNKESLTFEVCSKLKASFRLSMTGTPIENSLEELFTHFRFLLPTLLKESDSPAFLKKKIRPFLLRRLKSEVLQDLPPKCEQTIWIKRAEEEEAFYEKFLQEKRSTLTPTNRFAILELILRLRQIACAPALVGEEITSSKSEQLLSDVQELASREGKGIIFSQFTTLLDLLEKKLQDLGIRYVRLDGKTRDREAVVNQFQSDAEIPIFLVSLKAGGVGLNLTAADTVFLYEPWWNEAVENQAIDRAHRLGRKGTVFVRRYIALGSIEERIVALKERKLKVAEEGLSMDEELRSFSTEELYELLF